MSKPLQCYLALPYTIELVPEEDGTWFVRVLELPGCVSVGDTPDEAVAMIRDAMSGWLELAIEDGDEIPEPRRLEGYSGKFGVRVPALLHKELVEQAEREGVSLNQYCNVALARAVGLPVPDVAKKPVVAAALKAGDVGCWPGLKAAVREALVAADLGTEAGELDERLFATHLDGLLTRIEAAANDGYRGDALAALDEVGNTLRAAEGKSPLLAAIARMVSLLRRQIEQVNELREGVLDETSVLRRARQGVRNVFAASIAVRESALGPSPVLQLWRKVAETPAEYDEAVIAGAEW